MATLELDPLFVKALRLLHSKAKDSADQLRQLLDDVLSQKQTPTLKEGKPVSTLYKQSCLSAKDTDSGSKLLLSKKMSPKHSSEGNLKVCIPEDMKKRESDKRPVEKMKLMSDFPDFIYEPPKRLRTDSPQPSSLSSSPSPQPLADSGRRTEEETEDGEGNPDANDFVMEMGLACIVCRQIDVLPGNQLIECQECHSLYHQECHRPPETDIDVNDPRRVWYCARCTKNMRKLASKNQKSSKGSVSITIKEPVLLTRNKADTPPPIQQPFKRTEVKVPTSQSANNSTSANKPIGLAGLAANFGGRASVTTTNTKPSPTGTMNKPSVSPSISKTSTAFSVLTSLSSSKLSLGGMPSATLSSKPSSSSLASLSSTLTSTSSSKANVVQSSSSKGGSAVSSSIPTIRPPTSTGNGNAMGGAKPASSSSLMSADKRLQIMKKKAAAKMQEKRRLSSK